ncbi:UNVERIFIED_CONTAM: hypothetical protein Sradi_1544600 [Sesamum radiatum]|uniref:Uncharacterized protein n=1 Tax=Sesamum radiatum TaxID=300843 RepID=A0AAW2U9A6_SESRA
MSAWEQGLLSAEATLLRRSLRRCYGVEAQSASQQAWEVLRRQSHWLGPGIVKIGDLEANVIGLHVI